THKVVLGKAVGRIEDEVATRGRLDDDPAVRQDVADVADDQRRALQAVEFLLQPPNLFLESDEPGLRVALLALAPPSRLQKLVVAVLERGDTLRHFPRDFSDLIVVHKYARR